MAIDHIDIKIEVAPMVKIDWPKQDELPECDPIGDIDDVYKEDLRKYLETMEERLLNLDGKNFNPGISFEPITITLDDKCCDNPKNHKKVSLVYSVLKVCSVCDSKLGDWK